MSTNGTKVTDSERREVLAAMSSALIDRMNLARKLGETYDGDRKVWEEAGYPKTIAPHEHIRRYRRQPAARRVVEMPVRATWREPPEVVEPDAPEGGTEFMRAWWDLVERKKLWSEFERADRLARLGRYSVMLIGVADTDDAQLAEPLDTVRGPDDLIYLSTFAERHVRILKWVTDSRNSAYGTPELYRIDLSAGMSGFPAESHPVHRSRLLHIVEDPLEDDVFGVPALEPIWNDLLDLEKVNAGTAEGYWQLAARTLKGSIDADGEYTEDDLDDLKEAFEEMAHKLRRHMMAQGLDLEWLGGQTADPTGAAANIWQNISAGSGIPLRILRGSETGERASSEDQKSFLGMVQEREQHHAEPNILRAFIDRMVELRILPQPGRAGYEVMWPERFQVPDSERAEANLSRARTAKELTQMGENPAQLVRVTEEGDVELIPFDGGLPEGVG